MITQENKIFFLKKHVSGEAKQAIEGFFFSGSTKAYENAMAILEERFGHPFIIQKAFRTKLDNWPTIPARNPKLLREYADFLRACKDASDQYPSLGVLNDCVENCKMVKKIPEWAALKWNREVQSTLDDKSSYPTFTQFVNFVSKEARIACNPMWSPYYSETKSYNRYSAKSLSTNTTEAQALGEVRTQKLCTYCKKKNHLISDCRNFVTLSIEKRRTYVRDNKLCYGCLNSGHVNKNCPKS